MTNQTFTNGYALLIGVGADLPVTVLDATALKDILIDPSRAAYPPEQVTLLTETSATRQNILAAFDEIIAQVNQNPDATVIIYYSGHGGRIQRTNEYFLVPFGY
ncbi:caspase family protein [Nostoc sp.]|uniref:caspase family protein n=1 Tax=Nostoc sp. TaxID=1180 RepID=UPI002FF651C1